MSKIAAGSVLVLLLGAAIPEHAVALRAAPGALHPVVDHVRPVPAAWVGLAMHLAPFQRVGLQVVAEPAVLRPGARHDGEEPALPLRLWIDRCQRKGILSRCKAEACPGLMENLGASAVVKAWRVRARQGRLSA